MRNIRLLLSYLGTGFAGWQKTPMGPSIEAALEEALCALLKERPALQAASRTDAGVHARGQVVNFLTEHPIPLNLLQRALNGLLPKEIAVTDLQEMPLDFHPTLQAKSKEYHYLLCTGAAQLPFYRHTSWHFPYKLDLDAMRRGATMLLGDHDYSSFCNERSLWDRSPICHLSSIAIDPLPHQRLALRIIGDHFLYKMMRNLAGTLAYVGCGKLQVADLPSVLSSKDRTRAGITAPAHGLILQQVFYENPPCPVELEIQSKEAVAELKRQWKIEDFEPHCRRTGKACPTR